MHLCCRWAQRASSLFSCTQVGCSPHCQVMATTKTATIHSHPTPTPEHLPSTHLQLRLLQGGGQHAAAAPQVPRRRAAAAHQPAHHHLRHGVVSQGHAQPGLHFGESAGACQMGGCQESESQGPLIHAGLMPGDCKAP